MTAEGHSGKGNSIAGGGGLSYLDLDSLATDINMMVCLKRPSVEKVWCYKSVIITILGNGEAEGLGNKDHVTLPPWKTKKYLQRHLRFLNQNKFGLKQPV